MYLGKFIKAYRTSKNISMDDFSAMTGLTKSYISILEKNINPKNNKNVVPSLTTIKVVADAIGVPLKALINKLDKQFLPTEELEIAKEIVSVSQKTLGNVLSEMESILLDKLHALNTKGQKKVEAYAEDISHSPEYRKHKPIPFVAPSKDYEAPYNLEDEVNEEEDVYRVPVVAKAAAGRGYANIEDLETTVRVKRPSKENTHLIQITGDSLYPLYEDGDYVWCEYVETADYPNKIYVVLYDGETYIKKIHYGTENIQLVSVNPKYAPIIVEDQNLDSLIIKSVVVEKAEVLK